MRSFCLRRAIVHGHVTRARGRHGGGDDSGVQVKEGRAISQNELDDRVRTRGGSRLGLACPLSSFQERLDFIFSRRVYDTNP